MPLVLIRTPTYRRPELLKRAMRCLQGQAHEEWICEIRDDCPDGSARAIVEDLGDPRIRHVANRKQKFLVKNLDDCFLRENPYGADYFYMLEDDNQVQPRFLALGCDILQQTGLNLCQINQVIEHRDDPENPHIGSEGIFDGFYDERAYEAKEFHLALFGAVGISNGAVFWSKNIQRELAFQVDTIPALDEPLRTRMVSEPIYISREKLAVWAKNEQTTNRNLGLSTGRLRREANLKASIAALRRAVWASTSLDLRKEFLDGGILRTPMFLRLQAMRQAGIPIPSLDLSLAAKLKRFAVRYGGRKHPSLRVVK